MGQEKAAIIKCRKEKKLHYLGNLNKGPRSCEEVGRHGKCAMGSRPSPGGTHPGGARSACYNKKRLYGRKRNQNNREGALSSGECVGWSKQ